MSTGLPDHGVAKECFVEQADAALGRFRAGSTVPVVYLVRGDCMDYYCGCGGGHVLAVAGTEDEAKTLAEQAKGAERFFDFTIQVFGPFSVGALVPEDAR